MNFVHLRTNTEFSIVQGSNKIENLIEKVANDGMGAVAMTDLNAMFGTVGFYKEAKHAGVKPIVGIDITIQQEDLNKYQLILLAKNKNGYKSIVDLISKSYIENRTDTSVSAKEEWLADLEDVVILSGAKQGLIGQMLLADDLEGAKEVANQMKEFFGDDFYIELQRDGTPEETKYMEGAVQICSDLGIAPVATNPSLFTEREDYLAHEARYCISNKKILFDIKRERPFNKEMYVKTQDEMTELFSDLPQALENTVTIAKKCSLELELDKPNLPIFQTPNGETPDEYFAQIARTGLAERLIDDFPNEVEREEKRAEYEARLETEIGIIRRMGFPSYFLIVSDFITWAKEHDIPVGPGRGSGAGSLVAYSMKITDIDPLPYGLLFERFLNPDRVSMPDFDIDFCQLRRDEVYEYVRQKYGTDAVSQIGTFGTMATKAVIRDVGRVLGYPNGFNDTLSKMVNIKPGKSTTLQQFLFGDEKEGIEADAGMRERYDNEPDVKKLIDIALKIEGMTKSLGTHAAGVVISPTTLTDFTPLYTASAGGAVNSQFNKDDVESSGLVKFDFLGLTTLTIIKNAVDLINEKNVLANEKPLNLRKVILNDKEVYDGIFSRGNTTGVFQFESRGMTSILKKAKPNRLEDLTAITALYRPGPMEIIPAWLSSKENKEEDRVYPHEKLKGVLGETYGFMIYQEQVMQCAQIIAGYSLGEADILRRAMGKKKADVMKAERQKFIDGAAKHSNLEANKAGELFDLIDKFSGYGFNKSHAAAYSYLSYHTAYLKHHHPEEFFAANFNSALLPALNTDKVAILFNDATHKNNMTINKPDVNQSFSEFTVEGDNTLRYGLSLLKAVGKEGAKTIVEEREKNGPYTDFYDFLERVGKGHINKRAMDSLIKSGAFDSLHDNRASLFEASAEGLNYVAKYRKQQLAEVSVMGSTSLFDDDDEAAPVPKKKPRAKKAVQPVVRPELKEVPEWDVLTTLRNEKSAMGYFFSSNPYVQYYSKQLGGFPAATPLTQIDAEFENGEREFLIGGLVDDIHWWPSKKGAFVTLTDGVGSITVMMYADFLNDNKPWFKEDSFASIRIKGEVKYDDEGKEEVTYKMVQGFNYDQTLKLTTNKIFVGSENKEELIEKFDSLCNEYIGSPDDKDSTAILCVPSLKDPSRRNNKLKAYTVKADMKLIDSLAADFGEEWVKLSFKENLDNIVFPDLPYKNNGNKKYNNGNKKYNNSNKNK